MSDEWFHTHDAVDYEMSLNPKNEMTSKLMVTKVPKLSNRPFSIRKIKNVMLCKDFVLLNCPQT